ncbi:pyruvate kinase [Treponema primitia ZAS-2]|uniref:Pyruvate kinase n=1 Tax=Treponema primitia (strain ATCC BAA-887 / DSM 12427 / ZAS-2) TaxID=545694 RepID=F5YK37_TREPZ|nr:pyruvate kinase [Treponema primitia]AEF83567.1 pyruvate kinase [Treponema primitia ZAS-2]
MKIIRNTHIICTMGPTTESLEMVRSLIRKGMNLARFNFSHGEHGYHGAMIARVREAAAAEGVPIALILDTKGPEIRTGKIRDNGIVELVSGEKLDVIAEADATALYGEEGAFTSKGRITVSYQSLADDIRPGARILIADGIFSLDVLSLEGRVMRCRVETGGELGGRKNVNILGVHTRLPAMSEKDMDDLRFGHEQEMDYVAASFIRKASDVTAIQKYLVSIGSDMQVIAKIEDDEGLQNIEEIIRVSAGIMVARGDLGVQIPPERVPLEQKRIISLCNKEGKPVITATQMLDSMTHNSRPTRAEAGDVANAILDGTDCVMLSGETANGAWPEAAVEVMDRIALAAESSEEYRNNMWERRRTFHEQDLGQVIAGAAVNTADAIGASCIIMPTLSGLTAQLVSKRRPQRCIVAATPSEKVRRRLLLYWGVVPVEVQREEDSEAMIQGAIGAAIKEGFAASADKVVVVAGLPVNSPITTNSIRVHVIGTVLGRGARGFGGRCTGRVIKAENLVEAARWLRSKGGEILLTHTLDESFTPIIRIVDGVILEGTSELSREHIKNINPNVVYVAQVPGAMNLFEENSTVTLDGAEKLIYEGTL